MKIKAYKIVFDGEYLPLNEKIRKYLLKVNTKSKDKHLTIKSFMMQAFKEKLEREK